MRGLTALPRRVRSRSDIFCSHEGASPGGFLSYRIKKGTASCDSVRATDGIRTRDPDLGKVVLYQLSHCRIDEMFIRTIITIL